MLVVETGLIVTGANTYGDVDDAKNYWDDMAYDYSSYSDIDIEAAIFRAMRYIETRKFIGYRYTKDQPLSWPRSYVYDKDGYSVDTNDIPTDLKSALYEGTFREAASPGVLQQDIVSGSTGIKRKKVDVLETEWFEGSTTTTNVYTVIDDLLSWMVVGGNRTIRT